MDLPLSTASATWGSKEPLDDRQANPTAGSSQGSIVSFEEGDSVFLNLPPEVLLKILSAMSPVTATSLAKTCKYLHEKVFADPWGYPWDQVTMVLCPHVSRPLVDFVCLRVTSVRLQERCSFTCPHYPGCGPMKTQVSKIFQVSEQLPVFPNVTSLTIPKYDSSHDGMPEFLVKFPAIKKVSFCPAQNDLNTLSVSKFYDHILTNWCALEKIEICESGEKLGKNYLRLYQDHGQSDFQRFLGDVRKVGVPLREIVVRRNVLMNSRLWIELGEMKNLEKLHLTFFGQPSGWGQTVDDRHIACIAVLKNLTCLNLSFGSAGHKDLDTALSDKGLMALRDFPNLLELHLPSGDFSAKGLCSFFDQCTFSQSLRLLHFPERNWGKKQYADISNVVLGSVALHFQNLENLKFAVGCHTMDESGLTDSGMEGLMTLPKLTRLHAENGHCRYRADRHPKTKGYFLNKLTMGPDRQPVDFRFEGEHFGQMYPHLLLQFSRKPGFRGRLKTDEYLYSYKFPDAKDTRGLLHGVREGWGPEDKLKWVSVESKRYSWA